MTLAADYFRMTHKQKRRLRAELTKEAKATRPDLKLFQVRTIVDHTLAQLMVSRGADA